MTFDCVGQVIDELTFSSADHILEDRAVGLLLVPASNQVDRLVLLV